MAGQRMTREAFDGVVQEKMKRYRVSMDQAISDTLRELEGPTTARRQINDMESLYRDKQRYSMGDLPHSSVGRGWGMETRRDSNSNQPYHHELGREPSGGRNLNPLLNRWGPAEPNVKERLYREELNATNRQFSELENVRSLDRGEFFSRDLNLARRSWELNRPIQGPEIIRDLRSPQGPMKLGAKKGRTIQHAQSVGSRTSIAGGASTSQKNSKMKPGSLDSANPAFKFSVRIVKWAKFNNLNVDSGLLKQHRTLFKVKTDTCKMIVDCFKGPMTLHHREMCFSSVKSIAHPALKSPKIDNKLLELLIRKRTVATKNDFFEVIKPFDREMMMIQLRLLRCATPLLMASNTFELKNPIADPGQLLYSLSNTVSLCRKSMVLIGQTFAMITTTRQNNILEALGVSESCPKPSGYPNFKDSFLFGNDFILQLKGWLKNGGNKFTLKSRARSAEATDVLKKEELKANAESQVMKAADPKVVATIDKLLEDAKKGNQAGGQKSEFWFLFDEGSNEYKYYRQKFGEFQESKGQTHVKSTQTKKCKQSPEELTCESVRAMLYAKKAQAVKRRLYKTLAFSRKRKQAKLKKRGTKSTPPVKVEEVIEGQELVPTKETTTENSACEVEVKSQETVDTFSLSDGTDAQKDEALPGEKEPKEADPQIVDVDDKTKDTAIKLAEFVVQMGPEIEQFSMENSVNNPEFWFLCEKESPAYKFYKSKVEEFKQAGEAEATDDEEIGLEDCDLENIRTGDESQNDSDVEMGAECEAAEAPSTESTPSTENTPVAAFSHMPTPARPPIARKRVANLKVGMLPPKRVCLVEEPKIRDPVRIEYERPRGRGRRYNRKRKPVDLEFANKKLTQKNVGFQMLSRMGWQEGDGLGSGGSGIKNPINVGAVSAGEGLGSKVKEAGKSTNFDVFRQRMIQMYKQKITK
ncbi:SURP and G-patch domain-containing protein 2-like [Rhinoderma darwinii]|uniref:SURP and G-patch domain-containing protein 2-like n=1 Tax=Rhinoderma darwinii TaxID=43563 RepID=UPI003F666B48